MKTIDIKKVAAHSLKMRATTMKRTVMMKTSTDGRFLYYYKVYTFIENEKATTLQADQVPERLKQFPAMPVTMWYDHDHGDVVPEPLQGREDAVKRPSLSFDDIKAYILAESGVEVTSEQLGEAISLHLRASASKTVPGPVNLGRVQHIIGLLNGKGERSEPIRLFCAAGHAVTAAQKAFGLKVRALINKSK